MHKYSNIEIKHKHGKKTVRKVFIHKNKGHKSVCVYKKMANVVTKTDSV